MATLPLSLDTLQSPPTRSPLMSPLLETFESVANESTKSERPSALPLLGGPQSQHSLVSPTLDATAATALGNISPALSSVSSLSPSFMPEMPQWKRDLIHRRKQNVQRTISATSPTSSSLSASPSITSNLKNSTSSTSMCSLAGSNVNIDQVASDILHSPTKDFNKLPTPIDLEATNSKPIITTTATKVKKYATAALPAAATTIKSTSSSTGKTTKAITIKSHSKEKTAKSFGGQYTAIATTTKATRTSGTIIPTSALTSTETLTATVNTKEIEEVPTTKEEITQDTIATMEEEYLEKSKTTKEYASNTKTIKSLAGEEDEDIHNNITPSSSSSSVSVIKQQQQQQMTTRLTGSSSYSSCLVQNNKREFSSVSVERGEQSHQQQYHNITGATNVSVNQSSSKCESERVCAADNNSVSSCSSPVVTVVKISQKLKDNQFIKNEQQQHKTKIIKPLKNINVVASSHTINSSLDFKSPTKTATGISSLASSSSSSCAIKKKMVAMQEMKKSTCSATNNANTNSRNNRVGGGGVTSSNDLDSNEDLSYGPGIVSKLRCRYLSLALRESMEQQRLNKDLLRRSTSLNNLLDDDPVEEDDDDDDEEDNVANLGGGADDDGQHPKIATDGFSPKKTGILKNSCSAQEKRFAQGSNGVGVTFTETSSFSKRSRHLKRGNDSLKRARSVEALLSEKSPWQGNRSNITPPTCVTIEDKIQNARERLHQGSDHMPPKRLTSIIDDTERPPPDLVKQTLKMFEATANRRPRCTNRSNSKGDVASKVETFKNIIKDQKPVVNYPKPVSPTKKLTTPNVVKSSLKSSSDLLQSPLGRKTMAVANSSTDKSTASTTNTLSEHTPDIIPRQKLHSEREVNKEKYTTMGINKEKFMSSLMEPSPPSAVVDSPFKSSAKEKFFASMVDSPVTALSKEFEHLKLSDGTPTTGKGDNLSRNGGSGAIGGGGGGGVDGCVGVDDAFHGDDQNTGEKMNTNEFSSSLKGGETDKMIKQQQINNEIQSNSNDTAADAAGHTVASQAHQATVKAHSAHSSSDLSDGEDDDEYGIPTTKRITRSALDNIAKAGTTQQFKFSNTAHSSSSPISSTTNSSTPTTVAGKQIGVIRPLLNTSTTASPATNNSIQKVLTTTDSTNMETLKHHSNTSSSSLTSREIEKNRINDLKKSSSSSTTTSSSSSPSTSLENVIKATNASSSSSSTSSSTSSSAASSASGYTEVDTVISATNNPLFAMRKRRQNPPAPPAEQTSMVFNFSNRKEVPDYIESDGVIFRRKRELPKPNESGFVLLGDLSVETSTDMDYDDFSMCPPSPCDVEFVNANIVIDGKSSIRQKSKDATFHVQFNDTLTSTFEYPSEASLIVEDSFTALNNEYTLPGESEFNQAFQNLVLENSIMPPLHHVADEIIQLPTTDSSSSPANTTPTKNILGNLPLDCQNSERDMTLTMAETMNQGEVKEDLEKKLQEDVINANQQMMNVKTNNAKVDARNININLPELPKSLEVRKSRKDLKLPLLEMQQGIGAGGGGGGSIPKPPIPVKKFHMKTWRPSYLKANTGRLEVESNDSPLTKKPAMNVTSHLDQKPKRIHKNIDSSRDTNGNWENNQNSKSLPHLDVEHKIPRVLSKPQYACFLRQPETERPIQRSRSNEFRKTYVTNLETLPVFRSNSLKYLEKSPYSQENSNSVTTTFSMEKKSPYFNPDVNSTKKFISNRLEYANRKSSLTELDQKSISHSNLPKEKDNLANNECKDPENLNQYSSSTEPKKISYKNQDPNLLECSAISLPNLTQTSNYKTNITETKTNNNLMCRSLNDMKQESEAISLISSSLSTLNATQDINDQTGSPINTDFDYSQIQQVSCSLPDVNKCLQPIIDREESDIFLDFGEVEETYSTKSLPDLTQNLDQHSLKTYVNDDRKSISTEDISEKHLNLLERGNYSIDISRKQNSKDSSPICNMSVDSLDISEDDDIQHEINHRCDIINPNSDINNIKMGLSSEMLVSQYANNETEENAKDISTLENIKSSINDLSEVLTSENNSSKNTQRYEILKEVSDLENNKSVTNNISHKSVLVSPENGSSLDDIQYESNQKKNDFNLENKNSCFKNVTNDISNELSSDNSSCLDFKQNSFSINEDVYKTSTESEDKKMNQKIIQYSLCEQKDKKIVDRSSCDRVESRKSVYEENVLEKSIETSKECHPKQQEFISIPSKAEDKSNFHINLQNESSFIRKNQTSNLSLHSSENIPEEKLIENNFKSSDNQKPLKDQIGEDLANSSQKSNTLEKIKTCLFREQFSCENNMQTFNIIDKNFLESCKDSKNETIVRSSEIIDIDRKLKSYEVSKDEIIATSFEREDIAAHNPEKRIAKSYEDSQIATSLQNLNDSKLMSYEHTKDEIIARSLEIEDIAVHNPGKRIAKSYEVSQSKDKVIATSVQNLNDSKDVIVPISSETVDIAAHNTDRMRLKSYEDSKSKDKIIATEVHNLNDRKLKLYEDSKDEIIARSSEIEDIAARNPEKRIMKSYEDSKDVIVATSFENEDIAAHNFDKRRLRSYEDFRINDNHEKRILKSYEDSKDEIVATSFENEDIAAYNFDRRRLKSYENSQSKDKIITNAEHNINNRKLMSYEDEIIAASLETEDIAVHNSDRRRLKSYKDSQSNDKIIATSLAMKNIAIHNLDERSPIKIFNKSSSIFPEYKATINDDLNEKSLETNDNILNKHNISQDSLDRPLDSLNLSSDLNETETLDKEFSEQNQKHSLNLSAKIINNPLDSRSKDPIPSSINANLNEKNFETDDNILNKHNISQDIPDRCLDTIKLSSDLNETETLEKGPIEQNQNHSLNLNENTLLNKPLAWRNKDPIPSPSKPDQIIINDLSLITKESNKKFNDLSQNSKTTTSCILQDCSSPSKVLKIKTSNKFSIFSNSSTKDISQQSTYGVGRKCNRNVSKSFKNALTLYESFNEKQPKDSLIVKNKYITNVQRSISLLEKSFQKTRKEFEEVKANSKEFSNKSGNCNFSISPLKRNTNDIEYSKKSRENISESSSQKLGNDMENNNNRSSNYFNDLKQITHGSDNDSFITNLEFSKHYPEQTMNTNANNSHDYKNLVVEEKSIYLDKDTSSSSCLVKDNMNSFNESSNITSKLQSSTIQHHNNLKDMVHDTHTLAVKDFSSTTTLAINKNSKLLSTNNQILQVDGVSLTTSLTSSNIVKNEFSYSPNSRSFRFSKSSSNSITMTNNDNARAATKSMENKQNELQRSAKTPPKVPPRLIATKSTSNNSTNKNHLNNSTKTTTTTSNINYSTSNSTSSIATSFKVSSYSNSNSSTSTSTTTKHCAPPLRRRIPGNTLYYV